MKLKKWLVSSLRTKLLVMFILLTVIPLIIVGMVSYVKSIHIISQNASTSAQLQASQASQQINVIFEDVQRFTEIGNQESTVQFLLSTDNSYEDAKDILIMFDFYRKIYPHSDNIRDIKIFNLDGRVISESDGVNQLERIPKNDPKFKNLLLREEQSIIIPTTINDTPVISITSSVISEITGEVIGFINILVDATAIEQILNETSLGDTGSFYIESEFGESIFFPTKSKPGRASITNREMIRKTNSGVIMNQSGTTATVFDTVDSTGWKVIGQAPVKEIMSEANEIRTLIVVTVVCSILFTITLYYFISLRMIRPIRHLKEKMKLASDGNLDVKVYNESSDEIADLSNSFNIMISKIKSLLQQSLEEQKQLTNAEFRALQNQINPHFLYNTLDNIIWMAESKKSTEVIEMTTALSRFFRITLSGGKDWITIEDELEHIRSYLVIQKIRYRDILYVSFHINEQILPHKILKLTLQPLIENAIYHGIKNQRGKGLIIIKGDFDLDGNIRIEIIDNGQGIKEERLNEIQEQLDRGLPMRGGNSGIGMYNVQQRIQLFFGKAYGLTVNSRYGGGTIISLTIPAEGESNEKDISFG
ncbi:two-component system, sensor histidine kinase YesM [Thalassobacillus cyri]|uniref:histidine kinase n=1 Tax=Thalassobacillus cyri TaxID=571932 RepID=A0A1H4AAH1_9BACI|nr:sensor histidine kinase [Thalassobacillus cyri]SEA32937.1 two-component system, sensor histidine kinase YesM [Thalassobacillus cyri]